VLLSNDCGDTWTEVYLKGGSDLATAADLTASSFVPDSTQWRHEALVIAGDPFSEVIIAFQNRGHYGQPIFVDNINIDDYILVDEKTIEHNLELYPNPAASSVVLSVYLARGGDAQLSIIDATGKLVQQEKIIAVRGRFERRIDLDQLSNGLYVLQLEQAGKSMTSKLQIRH
jgi:hypothetical protein